MKSTVYSIFSFRFCKSYWITMRPYLLFVSGAAGMTGFAQGNSDSLLAACGAFLAFFFSYGFGQALTDCFQMDTDSISSPYRPLVRGLISRNHVLVISLFGLCLCSFVLFLMNPFTLIGGFFCMIGLATYTYFKRRWWAGPFYNAWIVALLPIMGKLTAMGKGDPNGVHFGEGLIVPIIIGVFFSYANFVLMGYFKDISADRASGYNTMVVVHGWKRAVTVTDIFAVLSAASAVSVLWIGLVRIPFGTAAYCSIPVAAAAVVFLGMAQVGIRRIRDEKMAHVPIANVVRAFVLFRIAEILVRRPEWVICCLLYYGLFEWVLSRRPEKGQI